MFGFGHGPELIIILVIALIVLGPGKIPEIAQMLGKGLRELRQASSELQRTFDVNELMNPTPPAPPPEPPPVEAAPIDASTQTIAPPGLVETAKPKRTRKRPSPAGDADSSLDAQNDTLETAVKPKPAPRRRAAALAVVEPQQNGATSNGAEIVDAAIAPVVAPAPKPRRRPSRKLPEPVSLDAPA